MLRTDSYLLRLSEKERSALRILCAAFGLPISDILRELILREAGAIGEAYRAGGPRAAALEVKRRREQPAPAACGCAGELERLRGLIRRLLASVAAVPNPSLADIRLLEEAGREIEP